jgi:hypothetical protein
MCAGIAAIVRRELEVKFPANGTMSKHILVGLECLAAQGCMEDVSLCYEP